MIVLLADRSPCLRLRVLRELFDRPDDDDEVRELEALVESDPLVTELVRHQNADGGWTTADGTWRAQAYPLMLTCMALGRLGFLGFGADFPPVRRGVEFLLSHQAEDGGWPLHGVTEEDEAEGLTETPLQTSLPLRALAAVGLATEESAERAYEWLMARRLDDGAWPTGFTRDDYKRVAGYRRLPHTNLGCRSNTTAALQCLAMHPERRRSEAAHHALDHLLGRETRDAAALGFELARLLGAQPARGFLSHFARFDPALIVTLCAAVGATRNDVRVAALVDFVIAEKGDAELWRNPSAPQCSRWLTFELLRALAAIDADGEWLPAEPRTPFSPYPTRRRRY